MGDMSKEPSMEEILSSIKRIIREEGDGGPAQPRAPRRGHMELVQPSEPEDVTPEADIVEEVAVEETILEEDILELTPPPAVEPVALEPVEEESVKEIIELTPPEQVSEEAVVLEEPEVEGAAVEEVLPAESAIADPPTEDSIIAFEDPAVVEEVLELTNEIETEAKMGVSEAIKKGNDTMMSVESEVAARHSLSALSSMIVVPETGAAANTLEGLVESMLRPLIKEWLDANLPTMVETMVAKEISRITGGVR